MEGSKAFANMADTAAFDTAGEYAMLAFIEEQPEESDPNAGWTAHAKMMGARRFWNILRTLHLNEEPPKQYKPPTLKPPK